MGNEMKNKNVSESEDERKKARENMIESVNKMKSVVENESESKREKGRTKKARRGQVNVRGKKRRR